jgi:ABC-type Fe3+-hydroxamate transport system substrate-binding protein
MKRFFTLLTVTAVLFSFTYSTGIEDIVSALKGGNASQVARYFDNTVEITLPEKSNSYSKSQAEMILRDFFTNNPIKGFDVIHKGENAGSQYCIGTLFTKNASFRTTVFMKQKGDRQTLQEIRFENR